MALVHHKFAFGFLESSSGRRERTQKRPLSFLSLANDRLSVVATDVVELDAVVVDSVQNSQAGLTALTVVGLGAAVASGVRPVGDLVERLAGSVAPGHLPLAVVHIA